MSVRDAMASRRTIRRFQHRPVARRDVEALLEAALLAPSASNKQAWQFFATDSGALIARMAASVERETASLAATIPPAFQPAFAAYGDYFVRFREAPVVVVVAYRQMQVLSALLGDGAGAAARAAVGEMELQSGSASASMAVQNILLAAPELGLGASCMTGPMVAAEALKSLLGIPGGWRIAAVVPIGYPDETPASPGRKPLEAVFRWVD